MTSPAWRWSGTHARRSSGAGPRRPTPPPLGTEMRGLHADRARGHTGRTPPSTCTRTRASSRHLVSCPRSGLRQKPINVFRQLIVRFWEFFVFVSFSPSSAFSPRAFRPGRGEKVVAERLREHVPAAPTPTGARLPEQPSPRGRDRDAAWCGRASEGEHRPGDPALFVRDWKEARERQHRRISDCPMVSSSKSDIESIGINGTEGRRLVWLWAPGVSGFAETLNSGFIVNLRQTQKGSSVFAVFICRQFSSCRSGLLTGINPTESKLAALSVNFKKD